MRSKYVKKLYDNIAESYILEMFTSNRWTRYIDSEEKKLVVRMLELSSIKKGNNLRIADLGMGPGRWSTFFIKKYCKYVTGVDISPKMVDLAKKNITEKNFSAKVANIEKLPFKANSFDIVFCFRSFKYVDNPELALSEMFRILAPGGRILLELPNKSIQLRVAKILSANFFKKSKMNKHFKLASFYSLDEVYDLLDKNINKLNKISPFFILPASPLPNYFFYVWVKLERLLFYLLPKKLFVRSWVLILTK